MITASLIFNSFYLFIKPSIHSPNSLLGAYVVLIISKLRFIASSPILHVVHIYRIHCPFVIFLKNTCLRQTCWLHVFQIWHIQDGSRRAWECVWAREGPREKKREPVLGPNQTFPFSHTSVRIYDLSTVLSNRFWCSECPALTFPQKTISAALAVNRRPAGTNGAEPNERGDTKKAMLRKDELGGKWMLKYAHCPYAFTFDLWPPDTFLLFAWQPLSGISCLSCEHRGVYLETLSLSTMRWNELCRFYQ